MAFASKSPWVIHYDGSSCNGCDIEVLATLCPGFDGERFGVVNTGNPKHADIFLVTGSVNEQNIGVVREIYDQMLEPKVVVACGICACTGGVFHDCYNVIGGVMADIHPNLINRIKEFIKYLPPMIKEYHDVFTGNVIAQQRLKGVGVLRKEDAISYGASGPTGRACGWSCDVRKHTPYGVYDKVDFKEILYPEGDSFARYMVRMEEILESLHILEQLVDNIPAGNYAVKTKPLIKLPEGHYFKSVEASRGEFGVYLESRGDKYPYRVKFRSPCLPLVSIVDLITKGGKIADLIAIGGTLDYVVPDIDR